MPTKKDREGTRLHAWLRVSSALLVVGLASCSNGASNRRLVGSAICSTPNATQERIEPAGVALQGGNTTVFIDSVSVTANGVTLSADVRLPKPASKLAIPFLDNTDAHLLITIDLYKSAYGPEMYSLSASRIQGGPWDTDDVVNDIHTGEESPGEVQTTGDQVTLAAPLNELPDLGSRVWFSVESSLTAKGTHEVVSNEQTCPGTGRISIAS